MKKAKLLQPRLRIGQLLSSQPQSFIRHHDYGSAVYGMCQAGTGHGPRQMQTGELKNLIARIDNASTRSIKELEKTGEIITEPV
jgi:hypothetical protein